MNAFVIETERLVSNIAQILRRAGERKVYAVVKGDGYGFGLVPYAKLLCDNGVSALAVTEPEEVSALRTAGLSDVEILMLRSTALPDEVEALLRNRAVLTIGSHDAAVAVNGIAGKLGLRAQVHIKIDTGMGRYGFEPGEIEKITAIFQYMEHIDVRGIYTHLNAAFGKKARTLAQIAAFRGVVDALRAQGFEPGLVHFANSSAFYKLDGIDLGDAVRIGSAFTGRLAFSCKNELARIGFLESRICEVRWLSRGATVGYGGVYRARSARRIAIVPLGYSHGFAVEKVRDSYRFRDGVRFMLQDMKRTLLHERLSGTVNGKSARVLGHVGMLHTVLDVTDIPCQVGDRVQFSAGPLYVDARVCREYR